LALANRKNCPICKRKRTTFFVSSLLFLYV